MYQRKPGEGSLFQNGYKQKDTHPDHRGEFLGLDGVIYEIAGWNKSTRQGDPWISIKVQPKRERRVPKQQPPPPTADGFDDDIPF